MNKTDGYEGISQKHGFMIHDEWVFFKGLLKSLPKGARVVNIGAGCGTSGICILEAKNIARSWTVDFCLRDSCHGSLEWEKRSMAEAGYDPIPETHSQVLGDSARVGIMWEHKGLDFVFVDADHSYEGAFCDIDVWLKNIRPGGVIAVHDVSDSFPGVQQAVSELLEGKYEHLGQHGTLTAYRV